MKYKYLWGYSIIIFVEGEGVFATKVTINLGIVKDIPAHILLLTNKLQK